jgi:hypothetical protein
VAYMLDILGVLIRTLWQGAALDDDLIRFLPGKHRTVNAVLMLARRQILYRSPQNDKPDVEVRALLANSRASMSRSFLYDTYRLQNRGWAPETVIQL